MRRHMPTSAASPPVELLVNGRPLRADAPASHITLLDFLRSQGLTGAKEGCAEGECGACAVAMVVADGVADRVPGSGGSAYRAINSYLMLLPSAAGREFYTVESLAERGQLSAAQAAMAAAGGSQCGYCTPGFVVSLFAEQYRRHRTGRCDPLAMAGNLCRCTGYRPIRDAALSLGAPPPGAFLDRLSHPAPALHPVRSPGFSRPVTVEECLSILAEDPSAQLLAGGTDLGVESNLHHRRWAHLVSIEAIEELQAFDVNARSITIGAALPIADIGLRWTDAPPAVHEWLTLFASPPIRHRATLGGNLATASPIGDAAPLLLALDASLHIAGPGASPGAGPGGRRTTPLSAFFTGYRTTTLARGELITAIEIPRPLPAALRFYKVAKRRLDDISTVAAAMALDVDDRGHVQRARFAFGGVAATPLRLVEAEEAVVRGPRTASRTSNASSAAR